MKRKTGEIFEMNGKKYLVRETGENYPDKCKTCSLYKENSCFGELDITGDCLPYIDYDSRQLVFDLIKMNH